MATDLTKHMRKRDYRAYNSWYNMKDRCNNSNNPKYHLYKGKGITYNPKWETFEGFLEDMGERPDGTSIDRINGDLGYYKENCRWADKKTQANNIKRKYTGTVTDMGKYKSSHHRNKPYEARVYIEKKTYCKYFTSEIEAQDWLQQLIKEKVG